MVRYIGIFIINRRLMSLWLIGIISSLVFEGTIFGAPTLEWVKQFNASGDYRDCGYCIVHDRQGNVYVSGQGFGKTSMCDITTIKYSPTGEELWIDRYNGPGNGPDKPYDMAIDNTGNIYITGISEGGDATFEDFVVLKYSPTGTLFWSARYDGSAHDYDCPKAIALDKNGNVYVTGMSWGGDATWEDIATVKFDSEGNLVWVERYNGSENDIDMPMSITVDDKFNVYVTGLSFNWETDEDFVTLKYAQPDEARKEQQKLQELAAKQQQEKPKKRRWFRRGS